MCLLNKHMLVHNSHLKEKKIVIIMFSSISSYQPLEWNDNNNYNKNNNKNNNKMM